MPANGRRDLIRRLKVNLAEDRDKWRGLKDNPSNIKVWGFSGLAGD